jgi:hypothetical protein
MKLPLVVSLILPLVIQLQPPPPSWLFDDFESAEHVTAHQLAWIALGDDLFGGTSTLVLETVPGGRNGSGHALRLHGNVSPAATAFAGAWAPLDGAGRPLDLGAFDALRFFARGEGTFQAGLRSGPPNAVANFMSSFTPGAEWRVFEVSFDRLAPVGPGSSAARWSPQEVHYFGITTFPGSHGPFRLEVDDVELVSHHPGGRPVPAARPGPARAIRCALAMPPANATWRELARDPAGDGKQPSLPDAVSVATMADDRGDRVWFRIALRDAPPLPWLGLNLAFDIDGDTANGTPWWGVNTAFRFDRLVTVYLFKTGRTYQGVVGTADTAAVAKGEFMAGGPDLRAAIDRESSAFLVGVPRSVLGHGAGQARFLAAVGSAMVHNDDVPDTGALSLPR